MNRMYHLAAILFCLAAMRQGVRTTADLEWPYDPDHFRDIAQAQTIRDGDWLQDPFYRGETVWYNPLLPGTVAAISYLTGQPIHRVATRAGAYLNLAAPLAFYLLVFRLSGPASALASLVGFLFVVRAPTWAAPTYSPWLFASLFAQPFFYLTLAEFWAAIATDRWWRYLLAGVLLGATFLAHTAPAMLAGVSIVAITGYRAAVEKRAFSELARGLALILGPAILIASPFLWSIVGHYQLRIHNPLPLMWRDPDLPPDRWQMLWAMMASRGPLNILILLGLVAIVLGRLSRLAVLIVTTWLGASVVLFAYNNYVIHRLRAIALPPSVPAHHFLVYGRAAEMVLFGLGVSMATAGISWIIWRTVRYRFRTATLSPVAHAVFAVLIAAIVIHSYPGFVARDAFGPERDAAKRGFLSTELREVIPWIRANSRPTDVFLTAESACLSLVGPAGRKCVLAPRFFSNPYVDWDLRRYAHQTMWNSLTVDDCRTFQEHGYAYRVRYVMTVESRTPHVETRRCGLVPTSFQHTNLRIYRAFAY